MSGNNLDSSLPCEAVAREHSRGILSLPSVVSKPDAEAQQQEPQLAHEAVQEEPNQYIPGAWMHTSPAVVSVPESLDEAIARKIQFALWKELGEAIRNGDSIPAGHNKTTYKARGEVKNRALLVGGQYEKDTRNGPLSGTPNDILNIYRMLLNHGYEKGDIRILVARAEDNNRYKCQPTKKNIMKGLDWLVKGARKGDHRYFHFSGHGEVFESSTGKEAREILKDGGKVRRDDTELYRGRSVKMRVTSQTIKKTELKHYSEALSAYCHDMVPHVESNFDLTEWKNCYRIRDEELNEVFSRLPEGCKLTCTLDCCHSARIANNNFKLLGDGFRGSLVADVNEPPVEPMPLTLAQHTSHSMLDKMLCQGVILQNGSNNKPSAAYQISAPHLPIYGAVGSEGFPPVDVIDGSEPLQDSRGLINFTTSVYQYFTPPRGTKITMEEKLPDDEARQDKIVADMLTWGGCHQRQFAGEFGEGFQKEGYFTSAFVEAVNEIPRDKPIKVAELFENVKYVPSL